MAIRYETVPAKDSVFIKDLFIFVSNGNDDALRFYQRRGFQVSHAILDGFITVLRKR